MQMRGRGPHSLANPLRDLIGFDQQRTLDINISSEQSFNVAYGCAAPIRNAH